MSEALPDTNVGNIEYIRKQDAKEKIRNNLNYLYAYGVDRAPELIDELEPADVVQVVHGKWKKIGVWGRVYRCNQCGNFLDFDGVNAGRGDTNFCPNCGAKMDGEE